MGVTVGVMVGVLVGSTNDVDRTVGNDAPAEVGEGSSETGSDVNVGGTKSWVGELTRGIGLAEGEGPGTNVGKSGARVGKGSGKSLWQATTSKRKIRNHINSSSFPFFVLAIVLVICAVSSMVYQFYSLSTYFRIFTK